MKRLRVQVPVVRLSAEPGDPTATGVCTLWCDQAASGEPPGGVPSDADRHLAPVAASLLDANLFESGCVAALAVRALGLRPPRLALWQRLRPHAWLETRRLYAAGPIPALGHSAELGLALALLRPGARFTGVVMATGSLSECGDAPGLRQALLDHDTQVRPVGHLADKLAELDRRHERLLRRVRRPPRALCFIPLTDEQGQSVDRLPAVKALRRHPGLEVLPVGSLGEAARRLGATRWPLLRADLVALAASLTLVAGLALGGAAWLWRDWPIPLAFERGGGQAGASEPFIACITADGRHTVPKPIARTGRIARVGGGQTLAWGARVGDPDAADARLMQALATQGYYLLFAILYADGQAILADHGPAGGRRDDSAAYRAVPGAVWEQWFQVPPGSAEGEAALVILARRDRPFEAAALRRGLDALAGPPGVERVNGAVNYLQSQAPGFLVYQFGRSSHVPDPCQD